jgi:3-deoxy-D-manno-octulosonic-acid transferase
LSTGRAGRGWQLAYQVAVHAAAPVISALMLWRGLTDRSYRARFGERFGLGSRLPAPVLWVHAVSVGEVQASAALVRALKQRHPDVPLLVTTFTPTGNERARALFADIAEVRYLPFDLPGAMRRFLARVRPRCVVILETELWPNLFRACAARQIPIVVASARLSERSIGRYLKLAPLFRPLLSTGVVVGAQEEADAQRFRLLGAAPARTFVTGNLKFDVTVPEETHARGRRLRGQYAPDRPAWVAGSTHAGEEEAVLAAHRLVLKREPRALLVLAPRHPPRFAAVAQLLASEGFSFARRSRTGDEDSSRSVQVLLLDTLGELTDFYAGCDVAFVGGSLVPIGGHNLLEPAALGVPILTGPSISNAPQIAKALLTQGAAETVQDAAGLAARVTALLEDASARERMGGQGRACIETSRGALTRILGLIEPLLTP